MSVAEQRRDVPMTERTPATPEEFADWVRPHLAAMSRLYDKLSQIGLHELSITVWLKPVR